MKYAQLEKHIKANNWYRQGGELSFFYTFGPYKAMSKAIGYKNNIITQNGRVNIAYFDKKKENEIARRIVETVKKNDKFIYHHIADWEKLNSRVLNFLAKKFRKPLSEWSDKELVENLSSVAELTLRCWENAILIEMFDPGGDKVLREIINKEDVDLSREEVVVLTSPDELSEQQKELVERIKMAQEHKSGKDISKHLSRHLQEYSWIENDWHNVVELSVEYFRDKITQDAHNITERLAEVEKIEKNLSAVKEHKKSIIATKKISPELQNVFYLFSRMTEWRDVRKKSICVTNPYFYQILKQLEAINDIKIDLLHFLNFLDIDGWKLSAELKSELERRQAGILYLYEKEKRRWCCFYGQEAKNLRAMLEQSIQENGLNGTCASKGAVEGVARIIETRADFSKVKPGDIIVATMTRPDYLPIMKIAGGIITDEGGLTCHAAIVSREFNIPCIVGLQTATTTIKDGAKIRIDADQGTVEKL